jgi:hypothetical protein
VHTPPPAPAQKFGFPPPQCGVHAPLTQVTVPFVGAGHAWPHVPQLATSVWKLRHWPLQNVKPALHAIPHSPPAQVGWPFGTLGHKLPQAPQLSLSLCTFVHALPPQ